MGVREVFGGESEESRVSLESRCGYLTELWDGDLVVMFVAGENVLPGISLISSLVGS